MSAEQAIVERPPMGEAQRYRVAAAVSVGFHALLLLLIGLLAGRGPAARKALIPIELTVTERTAPTLVSGGRRTPEVVKRPENAARPRRTAPNAAAAKTENEGAKSPAPRILTSNKSREPAAERPKPQGVAADQTRRKEETGPTYGPAEAEAPLPVYPKRALDARMEGRVTLAVTVGPDGKVKSVAVLHTSGHPVLDHAAKRALEQGWVFRPGMKNGKPAPGKVEVTIEFTDGKVKRG